MDLEEGFNVFYGHNGQGKSNLFEGIYILSIAKKYSNQLSFSLIVLVLSQCLAGFFNQTIVLIQSNLVMILIFTLLISANKND